MDSALFVAALFSDVINSSLEQVIILRRVCALEGVICAGIVQELQKNRCARVPLHTME